MINDQACHEALCEALIHAGLGVGREEAESFVSFALRALEDYQNALGEDAPDEDDAFEAVYFAFLSEEGADEARIAQMLPVVMDELALEEDDAGRG